MRLVINWAHRDYFPILVYQRGANGRVLVMNGLPDNVRLLHLVRSTDYLMCFTVGDYGVKDYEMMRGIMHIFHLDIERLAVLCNTPAQVEMAESVGLRAYFCNENAFIRDSLYRPQLIEKRFDAVSNARLIHWKRVHLAREVKNLAIIQGLQHEPGEYDDPAEIPHSYINDRHLTPKEVVRVLSASRVGLALSGGEGGCRASSEYMLCGLPVVSTPSSGGRDIWYDSDNSIICDPTVCAVREAVELALERLRRGEMDPHAIREGHRVRAQAHRKVFIELTARAFEQIRADADPTAVFEESIVSPGVQPRYRPYDEVYQALSESG